ncbi:MAG: S8 family serine peptidase [candidate division Zixibacteria bacterium]|nr:S8 family serine peptidase [candidate division Zixibacteria bacterium]
MRKTFKHMALIIAILTSSLYASEIPDFLAKADGEIEVVMKITEGPEARAKMGILQKNNIPRPERHRLIVNHLKGQILSSQLSLLDIIAANGDNVKSYKSFWISNAIYLKGDAEFIRQLAHRNDVEYVFRNLPLVLVEPVASEVSESGVIGAEPGLDIIGARQAWQMGLTGDGRIVCNIDTGVDADHPALTSSWRGANGATVAESWFDPYTSTSYPIDSRGHGTHTMGTMVGVDGVDTVGIAVGAQWIAAGVVDRGGSIDRTISDILSAFEWAADPDGDPTTIDDMPDVINNSWGVPAGFYGPCDMTFWDAIDNLEALGIVCVFAAGNEGPTSSTMRTPADRITSQFNSFSVGAIDANTMEVASFSSRGPSGCDGQTIKPEITAPGAAIRSCGNNGGYVTKSGTSMAAPHISGVVALLRQFNPDATVEQIKQAMMAGADDLGDPGEDNDYGYGLLNIMNSLYHMPPPGNPFIRLISVNVEDNQNGMADPGEQISFNLVLENLGSDGYVDVQLGCQAPDVEIHDNYIDLGFVGHHDSLSQGAFSLTIPVNIGDDHTMEFSLTFSSGSSTNSYDFSIVIGDNVVTEIATINTGTLEMSFSNSGQFGLGENSINPSGGVGFRYPVGSVDFMKEAALMLSVDDRISDAARDEQSLPDNDFAPTADGQPFVDYPGNYADYDGFAIYSDSAAEEPIGLLVDQKCFAWDTGSKFIIVEFTIQNISGSYLNNLRVGMFCDWDLALTSGIDDIVDYEDVFSLGYMQDDPTGWCIGVRSITDYPSSYRAIDNQQALADGFSEAEKIQFMADGFNQVQYSRPGDYSHLLTVGPYNLANGESEVVAFAFVVGESLDEITTQAEMAFIMYPQLTRLRDELSSMPNDIRLSQNYPNPFNNLTAINLFSTEPSQLGIYDVTGRQVKLIDIASAGFNQVIWDGKNDRGEDVVSGVYLYRIVNGNDNIRRKMIFLK